MTAFQSVLADIFDRRAEVRIADAAEERGIIAAAQSGDDDATMRLLYAYAPVLRGGLSTFRNAGGNTQRHETLDDRENLQQAAVTGLLQAIKRFDPDVHHRLAAIASQYVTRAVGEEMDAHSSIPIPYQTKVRFYGILRRAGGDVIVAASIAPQYKMTVATFLAALAAIRSVGFDLERDETVEQGLERLAGENVLWSGDDPDIADVVMVDMIFAAQGDDNDLTGREVDVLRHAYGFDSYGEPQSDNAVGFALDLSRPTTQRARRAGLDKGRARLGA